MIPTLFLIQTNLGVVFKEGWRAAPDSFIAWDERPIDHLMGDTHAWHATFLPVGTNVNTLFRGHRWSKGAMAKRAAHIESWLQFEFYGLMDMTFGQTELTPSQRAIADIIKGKVETE